MVLKNYLFSYISGNYQQYTSDYTESFIKPYCINCKTTHQIAVHRDGNLMHYTYLYKNNNFVYGISLVCGEVCLNLKWLYNYLQGVIEDAAYKGVLFYYNEQGIICKNIDNWNQETAEIDRIFRNIKEYINKQQSYWDILPPEDFSIPKDSKIVLSFNEDDKEKITDAIRHYNNVIVTLENINQSGFGRIVENLNAEKEKLQEEKAILETEIDSLTKQKKQYKWVGFLSILVVLALIIISLFNQNVNNLQEEISDREYSIDSLNNVVTKCDSIIYNQTQEIDKVNSNLRNVKQELTESKRLIEEISLYMPISASEMEIKNGGDNYGESIYSSKTTYIYPKLTVYSLVDGSVELYTKFYRPDGSLSRSSTAGVSPTGFSYKDTVYLSKNQSTTVYLSGWGSANKGHWSSGTYRIEVWYNDVCIKSKTFRIY